MRSIQNTVRLFICLVVLLLISACGESPAPIQHSTINVQTFSWKDLQYHANSPQDVLMNNASTIDSNNILGTVYNDWLVATGPTVAVAVLQLDYSGKFWAMAVMMKDTTDQQWHVGDSFSTSRPLLPGKPQRIDRSQRLYIPESEYGSNIFVDQRQSISNARIWAGPTVVFFAADLLTTLNIPATASLDKSSGQDATWQYTEKPFTIYLQNTAQGTGRIFIGDSPISTVVSLAHQAFVDSQWQHLFDS